MWSARWAPSRRRTTAPAKWSVGSRAQRATDADIERAFDAGEILRTHVLRPTWHFVLPADIRWLLTATAPRVQARCAYRYRQLGLDAATLRRGDEALAAALRGGADLTRAEAAAVLAAAGIDAAGQRLPYLLMHAELEAVVCSGPRKGKQHTWALLEERAPQAAGAAPGRRRSASSRAGTSRAMGRRRPRTSPPGRA